MILLEAAEDLQAETETGALIGTEKKIEKAIGTTPHADLGRPLLGAGAQDLWVVQIVKAPKIIGHRKNLTGPKAHVLIIDAIIPQDHLMDHRQVVRMIRGMKIGVSLVRKSQDIAIEARALKVVGKRVSDIVARSQGKKEESENNARRRNAKRSVGVF